MTHRYGVAAALFAFTVLFAAAPAHAQAPVTWVSGTGNNANSCTSPATACREFSGATGALAKVAAGGVIHVLPGVYSATTISKSVQIVADGGNASIYPASALAAGGIAAGFIINAAPTDVVAIRGMTFDRMFAFVEVTSGIGLVSGGALHLENCTLVNSDKGYGIQFRPSGNSKLVISNCTIANNAGGGIEVRPGAGATATVSIENTRLLNNNRGIEVFNRGHATVRNSTIAGNPIGVRAAGGNASARIANTTISGNQTGLVALNSAEIVSHRGNVLTDNVSNGAFTGAVNQQ